MRRLACCLALTLALPGSSLAADVPTLLKKLQAVGPQGANHRAATAAWEQLSREPPSSLLAILGGLDDAGPLAANWIRSAFETIAERELNRGGKLPAAELEKFVLQTRHSPVARRFAFEWLARVDKSAPDRLIPGMLQDPSVEFRRDAVQRLLAQADPLYEAKQLDAAAPLYKTAMSGARDLDQIEAIAKKLKEIGQPVDLPRHFGFLMAWKLIGPFDNVDKKGFAVAYPPEKGVDLKAAYEGKTGAVSWIDHATTEQFGMVDLNKALGKNMGAAAYAYAEFDSDKLQTVDFRIGSPCACKLWLNGKLLDQREVYHANTAIDQYVSRGELQAGKNQILLKICQNEQTESWAQDWQFQIRLCDPTGTAILSKDRLAAMTRATDRR